MFTTLAVVALSGLTAGKVAPGPIWLDDYRVAQTRVSEAGKPMAVFVGTGKAGWEGVITGGLDPAVSKVLSEKFVCLYVDTTTAGGRGLARALQVGERGLVVSDKSGSTQAYSANGTVSAAEAQRALLAYADPASVTRTEIVQTAPATAPAPPPPGMPVGGSVYMGGPGYVGAPGYMGGSGCGSSGCGGGGGFSHGSGCCGMFGGGGWGFGRGQSGMGCPTASTGCGATGAHYGSAGSCGGHSSCCGFGGFLSGCFGGRGLGGGWGGGCGGFMSHGGGCK